MEKNFIEYDLLVSKLATNLLSYSKRHNNEIRIGKFDKKNKRCLFIYEVAGIVSNLSSAKVKLELPWYKKIFMPSYWRVKSSNSLEDAIDYNDFLNFTFEGTTVTPEEIYEEYYK